MWTYIYFVHQLTVPHCHYVVAQVVLDFVTGSAFRSEPVPSQHVPSSVSPSLSSTTGILGSSGVFSSGLDSFYWRMVFTNQRSGCQGGWPHTPVCPGWRHFLGCGTLGWQVRDRCSPWCQVCSLLLGCPQTQPGSMRVCALSPTCMHLGVYFYTDTDASICSTAGFTLASPCPFLTPFSWLESQCTHLLELSIYTEQFENCYRFCYSNSMLSFLSPALQYTVDPWTVDLWTVRVCIFADFFH